MVGGSIAGCAAAIALARLGCEVTVYERSRGTLQDRGAGIVIPLPLRSELQSATYLPDDYPVFRLLGRRFVVADGTADGDVRWEQPGPADANNWGVLWRHLRSSLPSHVVYREATTVAAINGGDQVHVEVDCESPDSGTTQASRNTANFDVVIGADGYRSHVRATIEPSSTPHYAGYVLWRGNFSAMRLGDTEAWTELVSSHEWTTVGFDGGHALVYPIPDFDGGLRVNWGIYAPTPPGLSLESPTSIPQGTVPAELYEHYRRLLRTVVPPRLQPLFDSPLGEVSIQPIYDQTVDSYVHGRVALVGDAASVARPHTASGATKALQDARELEVLGATYDTWDALLAEYNAVRAPAGRATVELGQRIGRDQVEHTPPWHDMTPRDFERWTSNTLDGAHLYYWGDD